MIKLLDSFSTPVIRKPQTAPSYPKTPIAEASVKFSAVVLTDGPENSRKDTDSRSVSQVFRRFSD